MIEQKTKKRGDRIEEEEEECVPSCAVVAMSSFGAERGRKIQQTHALVPETVSFRHLPHVGRIPVCERGKEKGRQ